MSTIKSLKNFIGRNRHLMTPDQALQADKRVLEANVNVPSVPATDEHIIADKLLGNATWYEEEGNVKRGRPVPPLYPSAPGAKETPTLTSKPVETTKTEATVTSTTPSEAKG